AGQFDHQGHGPLGGGDGRGRAISGEVVALMKGGSRAVCLTKLRIAGAVVLAVGPFGTGASLGAPRAAGARAGKSQRPPHTVGLPRPGGRQVDGSREVAKLTAHTGAVLAVAYSPRAKLLATASADMTVRLWAARTNKEVALLRGHAGKVLAVA